MKRIFLIFTIILAILVVIFVAFVKFNYLLNGNTNNPTFTITPEVRVNPGLTVFSPKPNEIVTSPLKIQGVVNKDGWTGFEGQVGVVKLFDSRGKQLALGILTATTEWTTLPTYFETTLEFNTSDSSGSLVFHNENASGESSRDKTFTLPVRFQVHPVK